MKRLHLLLILLSLNFVFSQTAIAAEIQIGVAWAGKSGMAKRVLAGFEKGIKELAPDVKLEVKGELASIDELANTIAEFQKSKAGMVILRSNGAKYLGKNPPTIPTFIGGCNHPVQLGAVKNMEAPEGKITGVTYYLPVDTQFDTFQAIIPNMKSIMILIEKGHPGAPIDQTATKKICAARGLEYKELLAGKKEEIIKGVAAAQGKESAFIISNTGLVIDSAADIVAAAGKTPVLSYSSKPVKEGALGGFVADDGRLGRMLAQSAVDVLVKGKAVKDVPIKIDPEPKFFINAKTAQALGLDVPYSVLESAAVIE